MRMQHASHIRPRDMHEPLTYTSVVLTALLKISYVPKNGNDVTFYGIHAELRSVMHTHT